MDIMRRHSEKLFTTTNDLLTESAFFSIGSVPAKSRRNRRSSTQSYSTTRNAKYPKRLISDLTSSLHCDDSSSEGKRSRVESESQDEYVKKGTWSEEEDKLLLSLVQEGRDFKWSEIALQVPGRSAKQCRERWSCNLDPRINRSSWSPAEDRLVLKLQQELGNRWAQIATYLSGRTENAVKTRYKSISRAMKREWTEEEDALIISLHQEHGSNWAVISQQFTHRTKNAVKTRFRLISKGQAFQKPEYGDARQIWYLRRFEGKLQEVEERVVQPTMIKTESQNAEFVDQLKQWADEQENMTPMEYDFQVQTFKPIPYRYDNGQANLNNEFIIDDRDPAYLDYYPSNHIDDSIFLVP